APRRAYYELADSVESFGSVLRKCIARLRDCNAQPRQAPLLATEPACERARDMIAQARSARIDLLTPSRTPSRLLDHVDGLWRTLPLMDRASSTPFSRNVCDRLGADFDEVAENTIRHIERLAEAIRSGDATGIARIPDASFASLNKGIREAFREDALDAYELEAVEVVRWAWQVIVQQTNALTDDVIDAGSSKAKARPDRLSKK